MRYRVGVVLKVELEAEAQNEQDAIVDVMMRTENAVNFADIKRHWWEYVHPVESKEDK